MRIDEAKAKLRLSVNVKDILWVQVGSNCLMYIPHLCFWCYQWLVKVWLALIVCFWWNYFNTLWLKVYMLAFKPLKYINTLWLWVYVRYTPQNYYVRCNYTPEKRYIVWLQWDRCYDMPCSQVNFWQIKLNLSFKFTTCYSCA